MTISTLAFGKANASGSLRAVTQTARCYSSSAPAVVPVSNGNSKQAEATTQRELFMNVLNANATKRDAKQYLARFKPPKLQPSQRSATDEQRNARLHRDDDRFNRTGVNLGSLYAPARAISESPQFVRSDVDVKAAINARETIHVALVCLRSPDSLDDATLDGVALTLSQLVKLDMRILVVLDCQGQTQSSNDCKMETLMVQATLGKQAARLSRAIGRHSLEGARLVNGAIEVQDPVSLSENKTVDTITVVVPNIIIEPLKRSVVPIIPALAYSTSGQLVHTPASDVMSALTRLLSGLPMMLDQPNKKASVQTSLDRIILLDVAGGIPSKARGDDAHVFINLKQELEDIKIELAEYGNATGTEKFESHVGSVYEQHQSNLQMLQKCLAMLPSASSALIITPQEAASSSQTTDSTNSTIGTGTRRRKNTLVHNLLTNKPTVSSSLPVARLPTTNPVATETSTTHNISRSTLIKRGMPLTVIPAAPRGQGWQVPLTGSTNLDLETDPRIDLPALVHLIEDSFRRKLDLKHYLSRIHQRIAGLIIAGSYEGAAILTWEQPPGTSDPARLVPYLDKFAVLSSSQGSSGVADILFQAMVRTCFPAGVCWRSRGDNPVNKWYFERAEGHWRIPGTGWTMFWTGEGLAEDVRRWGDYVGVCQGVGASWVDDGKKPD